LIFAQAADREDEMRARQEGWLPVGLALLCAVQQVRTVEAAELMPQDQDGLAWWLHWIVRGVEVTGIAVIVLGALAASAHAAGQLLRGGQSTETYETYRANLGRAILLGLEFLVAADIIGTVAVDPTLYNLGVLAGIVLIRTFLSFSLEVEIQGRWPWQQRRPPGTARQTQAREDGA
jgi:uncharacterized membrane protein